MTFAFCSWDISICNCSQEKRCSSHSLRPKAPWEQVNFAINLAAVHTPTHRNASGINTLKKKGSKKRTRSILAPASVGWRATSIRIPAKSWETSSNSGLKIAKLKITWFKTVMNPTSWTRFLIRPKFQKLISLIRFWVSTSMRELFAAADQIFHTTKVWNSRLLHHLRTYWSLHSLKHQRASW